MDEIINDGGLGEQFETLGRVFQRFNFPTRSPMDRDYRHCVSSLLALNVGRLNQIVGESLDEWNLAVDMGNEETDNYYLVEFIKRIGVAIDEETEGISRAFASSQVELSQNELQEPERAISFTTNITSPDSPIFSQRTDVGDESTVYSPSSSMGQLELDSPSAVKKRKIFAQADTFLDRILSEVPNTALIPQNPRSRNPYVFGKLPFAIDWEVNRVACETSHKPDDFGDVVPALEANSSSPKQIWEILKSQVHLLRPPVRSLNEDEPLALAAPPKMPPPSSDNVWEILETKGWHSGQVHVKMTLECSKKGVCTLFPEPMQSAVSKRAFRRFGGDRFITISISRRDVEYSKKKVEEFLLNPFSVCGRFYRVFSARKTSNDSFTAHCFATDGAGLTGRELGLGQLYDWEICLWKNGNNNAAKLWSRISLSLSSTIPSLIFAPEQIRLVPDVYSATGECMTDGCAKASPEVFRQIWRSGVLAIKEMPSAIQGRIGGAKGVWYMDPDADPSSDKIWVEIRESQLKYRYDKITFQDPHLRTFDVCKAATAKTGQAINNQLIGILSHCGVPAYVFQTLLEEELQTRFGVVNTYLDNPQLLRKWIASLGRIYGIRCSGMDYTDSSSGEEAVQEPNCITYDESGTPTMVHEACVTLLESGFLPKTNITLRNKLKDVLTKACDKLGEKLHVSIARSTSMMCIADDLGILEENEVSIRFSKPFFDEETGMRKYYLDEDVLVARNPALLPSDIQKVRAVNAPRLSHLTDVIVFSGKGSQSKVALLSGGDYDGDMVWICWEKQMVDAFRNASPQFAQAPPNFLSDYFDKDTRRVSEIVGEGEIIDADKFVKYGIESSLVMSALGTCTERHRDIVYEWGYENPSAIILAHLASLLVDAPKQGLSLKIDKWIDMLRGLKTKDPEYVKPRGEGRRSSNHVMDVLVLQVIPQFRNRLLGTFHANVGGENKIPLDADIRAFYERFQELHAPTLASLTEALRKLKTKWTNFHTKNKRDQERNRDLMLCSPQKPKSHKPIRRCDQDELDAFCVEYESIVIDGELGSTLAHLDGLDGAKVSLGDKIKAATAYCMGGKYESGQFVWSCGGFRALCEIKCNAVMGRMAPLPRILTEEMYISLKPNSSFVRAEEVELQNRNGAVMD